MLWRSQLLAAFAAPLALLSVLLSALMPSAPGLTPEHTAAPASSLALTYPRLWIRCCAQTGHALGTPSCSAYSSPSSQRAPGQWLPRAPTPSSPSPPLLRPRPPHPPRRLPLRPRTGAPALSASRPRPLARSRKAPMGRGQGQDHRGRPTPWHAPFSLQQQWRSTPCSRRSRPCCPGTRAEAGGGEGRCLGR